MLHMEQQNDENGTWQTVFPNLPDSARTCRHVFGLYIKNRLCDNQFNCNTCAIHKNVKCLEVSRRRDGWREKQPESEFFGLHLPADRLYHRGHSWLKKEDDGTYITGIDDFGNRLIGTTEDIDYPDIGSEVAANEPAWIYHMEKTDIAILSPVSGKVVKTGGPADGWYLKIKPDNGDISTDHLLCGGEVKKWIMREIERLQELLSDEKFGVTFADGGVLLDDLPTAYPAANWSDVYRDIFLQR